MIKPLNAPFSARHRWSIASRTVAGTLGTYGVTALGVARAEAVTAATLASYAVFAVVAMAVFHAASPARAWAWLIGAAVPLALLSWLLASPLGAVR